MLHEAIELVIANIATLGPHGRWRLPSPTGPPCRNRPHARLDRAPDGTWRLHWVVVVGRGCGGVQDSWYPNGGQHPPTRTPSVCEALCEDSLKHMLTEILTRRLSFNSVLVVFFQARLKVGFGLREGCSRSVICDNQ